MEQKDLRRRSQELRKQMTKEERHLWYDFLKTYPVQFKRQYSIGPYFVDFYCFHAKLIIELDGSQHCEPKAAEYDRIRTDYLQKQGFYVLRFSNLDVMTHFCAVCETIDTAVRNRVRGCPSSVSPMASHLPPGEGFGRIYYDLHNKFPR